MPSACVAPEAWWRDPLSHPAIRAMTERERADLPFRPEDVLPE